MLFTLYYFFQSFIKIDIPNTSYFLQIIFDEFIFYKR